VRRSRAVQHAYSDLNEQHPDRALEVRLTSIAHQLSPRTQLAARFANIASLAIVVSRRDQVHGARSAQCAVHTARGCRSCMRPCQ